jgi:hypothetical protein
LFAGVPYDRPVLRPVVYYLLIAIIGAFFALWWGAVFTAADVSIFGMLRGLTDLGFTVPRPTAPSALLDFFLAPFLALLGLTVWSLLLHLFVLMLAPDKRTMSATIRTLCYASGPGVLQVVPVVGALAGAIWSLLLITIGLREAHRMSTGRAVAVVILAILLPVVAVVGVMSFFLMLAFAAA